MKLMQKKVNLILVCFIYLLFPHLAFSTDISEVKVKDMMSNDTTQVSVHSGSYDHTIAKGEFMAHYNFSFMSMDGNRDGTSSISNSEVLSEFIVVPEKMDMQMQMFGLMYGLTDNWTFSIMGHYMVNEMDHLRRDGVRFKTKSSDFGDTYVSALYDIYDSDFHHWHLGLSLSLPTGEDEPTDSIPAPGLAGRSGITVDSELPYPMRLGSGTLDLTPSINYWGIFGDGSITSGGNLSGTFRSGEADGYTLGNIYSFNIFFIKRIHEYVSTGLSLKGTYWDEIDGSDPDLNPNIVQTAVPSLQKGKRIELNGRLTIGTWNNQSLSLNYSTPIYQDLEGPQLETDWSIFIQWQYYTRG